MDWIEKVISGLIAIIILLICGSLYYEFKNPCIGHRYTGNTTLMIVGKVFVPAEEKICVRRKNERL